MPKASIILLSFLFAAGKVKEDTTLIRTRIHGLIIECEVDAEVRRKREKGRLIRNAEFPNLKSKI